MKTLIAILMTACVACAEDKPMIKNNTATNLPESITVIGNPPPCDIAGNTVGQESVEHLMMATSDLRELLAAIDVLAPKLPSLDGQEIPPWQTDALYRPHGPSAREMAGWYAKQAAKEEERAKAIVKARAVIERFRQKVERK